MQMNCLLWLVRHLCIMLPIFIPRFIPIPFINSTVNIMQKVNKIKYKNLRICFKTTATEDGGSQGDNYLICFQEILLYIQPEIYTRNVTTHYLSSSVCSRKTPGESMFLESLQVVWSIHKKGTQKLLIPVSPYLGNCVLLQVQKHLNRASGGKMFAEILPAVIRRRNFYDLFLSWNNSHIFVPL